MSVADNGILPCIKVRKRMLKLDGKKGISLEIYQFWHKEMIYKKVEGQSVSYGGQRWIVETVFSCIKRTFDREYVYSVRLKNMIQEMMLKASLYNKMISIQTKQRQ